MIPTLDIGGAETVVVRLVERLSGQADHLVVTPSGDGPIRERLHRGVPVVALRDTYVSGRWNALHMAKVFRAFKPHIVHSRNFTSIDAVVGARLAGVPVVIHGEHGREAHDPEGRDPVRRRVRRLLSPLVTQFVVVSRDLARWLIEHIGVPARKVVQIPNGVDTELFSEAGRADARQALGVPDDCVVLGTVGRLEPVKDQASLIAAFARVASDYNVLLLIAGDGPSRPELTRLVRDLGLDGRVRLLGERTDIPHVLKAMDIFVLSSIGEGMSNAILEAMASGRPVIATRVGGNPELVDDGETGILTEPRSPAALERAMRDYLDHPSLVRRHGGSGRLLALSQYSLERMVGAYADLYHRLAAPRVAA